MQYRMSKGRWRAVCFKSHIKIKTTCLQLSLLQCFSGVALGETKRVSDTVQVAPVTNCLLHSSTFQKRKITATLSTLQWKDPNSKEYGTRLATSKRKLLQLQEEFLQTKAIRPNVDQRFVLRPSIFGYLYWLITWRDEWNIIGPVEPP